MHAFRKLFAHQKIFFVLMIIGLAAMNFIWLVPTLRNTRTSASVFALTVAERIKAEMQSSLEQALIKTQETAGEVADAPDQAPASFQKTLTYYKIFTSISLVDRTGQELVRVDRMGAAAKEKMANQSKNAAFYLALQGAPAFTELLVSPNAEPYITIMVPVPPLQKNHLIERVLVAEINLRNLLTIIRLPKIGSGHVYVLNEDGVQILHPDIAELTRLKNFLHRPIVKKVLIDGAIADGLALRDRYVNENGQDTFTVGMPITITKWGIFVEQPRSEALGDEREALLLAMSVTVLAALLFFVIVQTTMRLQSLAVAQKILLMENDQSAKMLVRRDIELTSANTRLQEIDHAKSEFVSVAAHQLRTPLTGLRWSYHALLDEDMGPLNSEQKKIIQDGLHASIQMITLINDLLNVAHIEEGRFGFTFKYKQLEPILEKTFSHFQKIAEEKGIALSTNLPVGHLPPLSLDEEKIAIVFDNLLDNAIKYTPPGGTIEFQIAEEPSLIRVSVKDSGIGIPKHQLSRIFTKFFRADNAMLFQTAGNGLGLYVAKNIVETHGGSMSVESSEEKGSVFIVTLPIRGVVA